MADQTSEGLLSPFLRRRRYKKALPYLNGRVLDFGCAVGMLASEWPAAKYLGVDRDKTCLDLARRSFPEHQFVSELPESGTFDTIAALAVIEHLANPEYVLQRFSRLLAEAGRIVITTPHPAFEDLYSVGARLGLFSHAAHEEHETLITLDTMRDLCAKQHLVVSYSERFLFGANQLFVLALEKDNPVNRPGFSGDSRF
jgi:SAM-dependent methyltransferase